MAFPREVRLVREVAVAVAECRVQVDQGDLLGGSHLPLLAGFDMPADQDGHAVTSLDWWHTPAPSAGVPAVADQHARVVEARKAAEAAAIRVLAASPRRLRSFRRLLAESQYLVPIREEQVRELTIAWPVMRRAVMRIGEALAARGVIAVPDDVFFLTRDEARTALAGRRLATTVDVAARRSRREEQARPVPPVFVSGAPTDVGRLPAHLRRQSIRSGARFRLASVAGPRERAGPRHSRSATV